jgi:hypothetical protein
MQKIKLSKNKYALVDDADFTWLNQWKWSLTSHSYASRIADGKQIYMHRLITNAPKGMEVDHINGDSLNNCQANLRICTKAQNAFNQKPRRGSSPYKGVSRFRNKWQAHIRVAKDNIYVGLFNTQKEAALAYDMVAKQAHGSFARLNFNQ